MSAATPRSNKNYRNLYRATSKAPTGRYDHWALDGRCGAGITRANLRTHCAPRPHHLATGAATPRLDRSTRQRRSYWASEKRSLRTWQQRRYGATIISAIGDKLLD